MAATPREKLSELVVKDHIREHLEDYVEIFRCASDPKKFIQEFAKRIGKGGFGAGYQQIVGPMFQKLYAQDNNVRRDVHRQLGSEAVTPTIINDYFSREPCGTLFHVIYEDEIPVERREEFINKSDELMLQLLRKHLGFG